MQKNSVSLKEVLTRMYERMSRLFAGNTIVHVQSDTQPAGFEPVEGGLEDVYFSTLSTLRRAA